jgi:septum formation protein
MKQYIVLASKSKRRSQILTSCSIRHKVIVSNVKEHMHQAMPVSELVALNARKKAEYAARLSGKNAIVLGADTLVLLNNKIIGKPRTSKEALNILKYSNDNKVYVYTGLYLLDKKSGVGLGAYDKTEIKVKKIGKKDVPIYFKLIKSYDKAGGFTMEGLGMIIFDNIKGSYFNVLGLPMGKLEELFKKLGYNILDFVAK